MMQSNAEKLEVMAKILWARARKFIMEDVLLHVNEVQLTTTQWSNDIRDMNMLITRTSVDVRDLEMLF